MMQTSCAPSLPLGRFARRLRPVSLEQFRVGMRQLASGVTLITTQHEGRRYGLTATAVCSLSAEPPRLIACVNRSGVTCAAIERSGRMAINLLARQHEDLARRFATASPTEDRFETGPWVDCEGVPALADASAVFDCTVHEVLVRGTHAIFICDVDQVIEGSPSEGLIYVAGQFAQPIAIPRLTIHDA